MVSTEFCLQGAWLAILAYGRGCDQETEGCVCALWLPDFCCVDRDPVYGWEVSAFWDVDCHCETRSFPAGMRMRRMGNWGLDVSHISMEGEYVNVWISRRTGVHYFWWSMWVIIVGPQ